MKLKQFKNIESLEKEINAYVKITQKTHKKLENLPPHLVLYTNLENENLLPSSEKNSTTKKKFTDHSIYKNLVNDLNYPNEKDEVKYDTWYKDIFYGRVDYNNNPIYHNYWIFQDIGMGICVFDFVADAFEEMKIIFSKKKKRAGSSYLQELSVKSGNTSTINPEKKYIESLNKSFEDFLTKRNKELKTNKKIKNFSDFKKIFINHLKSEGNILTFQGFFDNVNVDIYDSYLAFDIYSDGNDPSDATKLSFLNDPNYDIYETAARQAGFFVDQNKPWRLVADLKSIPMVAAMKRRYKATEELLKTKNDIYKLIDIKNNIFSTDVLLSGDENLNYLISLVYGNFVQDKKYILNFADYFRKEFPQIQNAVKTLRDIFATYINNKKVITPTLKLEEIDFPKREIKISNLNVKEVIFNIYKAVYDISFILDERKTDIDFIYQSLESQLKVLQVINKPIEQITNKDVYNATYCQVSDYVYFTYLPRKLEEYYNIFLKQEQGITFDSPKTNLETVINAIGKNDFNHYDSYVIFSKTADGKTKAIYNKREAAVSEKIKLSDNLQNDFYSLDLLIDHLECRLFEEKVNIDNNLKNEIINQVKSLYEKSLEEYKNGGDYSYYRNLALAFIETYVFNLVDAKKTGKQFKKAPFYALQYFYKSPEVEPLFFKEKICLTLPERSDILVEQEVCGKFPIGLSTAQKDAKKLEKQSTSENKLDDSPFYD